MKIICTSDIQVYKQIMHKHVFTIKTNQLKPISANDLLSRAIRLLMISHQLKIDQLDFHDLYTSEQCFPLNWTLSFLSFFLLYTCSTTEKVIMNFVICWFYLQRVSTIFIRHLNKECWGYLVIHEKGIYICT